MRAVVQRVKRAAVTVDNEVVGRIGHGLLVLLGVHGNDNEADLEYILTKTLGLRVFEDDQGKMNRALQEVNGELLIVSQFTLYGDCRKGRRPSFSEAAAPEHARHLYELFCERARACGVNVQTGRFAAMMDVELINDGPVTLLLDSTRLF